MPRSASPKVRSPRRRGFVSGQDGQAEIRQIFAILHKWGIHTLGQLAALDKEELRAGLRPEAVTLWLRANGQANRLLKFVLPPETFEEICANREPRGEALRSEVFYTRHPVQMRPHSLKGGFISWQTTMVAVAAATPRS